MAQTFVWEEIIEYLKKVDAVMLSHGHWDHAGGLTKAFDLIVKAKGFHIMVINPCLDLDSEVTGESGIPCFLHPGMFRFIPSPVMCKGSFQKT